MRWGAAAEGFLSLFPTTVVLPGIADRATLEALSALRAATMWRDVGRLHGADTRSSRDRSSNDLASPPTRSHEGSAARTVLDAGKQLGLIQLTPAHLDPRFSAARSLS